MENLELKIDKKAIEKIHKYAKIVCSEARSSRECYGFLLAPLEKNDGVVYDCALACNQRVTSVHGEVSPADVKATKEEYNKEGYKAIGCWQSHGHGNVFHSGTDDDNLDNLVIEAGTNCLISEGVEEYIKHGGNKKILLGLREGNEIEINLGGRYTYAGGSKVNASEPEKSTIKLIFDGGKVYINIENASESLDLTTSPEFIISGRMQKHECTRSIVYSLVVNSLGDNYAEARVIEWDGSEIKGIKKAKNLRLKGVEVSNLVFSEGDLLREVKAKVKEENFLRLLAR